MVSFCRQDLGLCAKTVFNKIRCTAAKAERIFAKRSTRCLTKSAIYKKSKPNPKLITDDKLFGPSDTIINQPVTRSKDIDEF